MQTKHKKRLKAARKSVRRTKRRDVFQELRDYLRSQPPLISLPAPPGTVPPTRWVPVRQAAQWRREIARDRRAGKPVANINREGVLTLRRVAEHEWSKLNDICLMPDLTLGRFIGVAEDADDFYYVVERLRVPGDQRRTYWSAVGECTSLREHMHAELYEKLEQRFTRGGCKPVRRLLILRESRPRARGKTGRK